MNVEITCGDCEGYLTFRGSWEKFEMKVFNQIFALITTLLLNYSETGTGILEFQFSGDLVFALAKIQLVNGTDIPRNKVHPLT